VTPPTGFADLVSPKDLIDLVRPRVSVTWLAQEIQLGFFQSKGLVDLVRVWVRPVGFS